MQVGNGREMLGREPPVKGVEPPYALVFPVDVGRHEAHVGGQMLEERPGKRAREHGDAHVGILPGQGVDHRHRHGNIAQGGESDDQKVFRFHG